MHSPKRSWCPPIPRVLAAEAVKLLGSSLALFRVKKHKKQEPMRDAFGLYGPLAVNLVQKKYFLPNFKQVFF